MRKRIMIVAAALMMSVAVKAQVFMLEEDASNDRNGENAEILNGFIPENGVEYDQGEYVSLGGGALLLAGLAGAYLLGKKKEK